MSLCPAHANSRFDLVVQDPEPLPGARRTCNRHDDCTAADAKALEEHRRGLRRGPYTDHCHDDCCEDCFGC